MASFNRHDRQINHIRNMSQLLERLGLAWDVRTPETMTERAAQLGRASA